MFRTLTTVFRVICLQHILFTRPTTAKSWIDFLPVFVNDDTTSLSLRRIETLRTSSVVAANPYVPVEKTTTDKPSNKFTSGYFQSFTLPKLILGIQPNGSTSVYKNQPLTGLPNFTRKPTSQHWRKRYRVRGDKSISANTSIILLSNQSYVVYPTAPTRSSTHFSTVLGVNITIETPSVLRDVIVETEGSGEKFEDLRMSSDEPFTMGLDDHNSTVLSENGPLEVETGEKDKKELDFVTSALTEPPNTTTTPRIDQMRIFRFFELH